MLLQEKYNDDLFQNAQLALKKAMGSRDKEIVKKISKLEKDHEKKLSKLEKAAEKTMDPNLRREWKQTQKIHSEFINKMFLELDR